MKITLNIQRYNPETDSAPAFRQYAVEVEPTERVLDALMQVKRFQDAALGFRKSCAHGVCGSDAMRINGRDRLACKTLVRDVAQCDGDMVTIEPLRGFPVQRDLIVDQVRFFEKYRLVQPFLINDEPAGEKERRQSPAERQAYEAATACILCTACFSACPVVQKDGDFLGPGPIVQAYRFLADSRDSAGRERLAVLQRPDGVRPCENHFECTRACPRGILITKTINRIKAVLSGKTEKEDS